MGGGLVPVNVFAARLRTSRASFVKAYPTTWQETLFDGTQAAFRWLTDWRCGAKEAWWRNQILRGRTGRAAGVKT